MQRTLYHFPLDPASRQVRLALGEKKLVFNDVVERYWEGRPAFLELNPSGLTPVLVEEDDGRRLVVCECRAILEHLEETGPEPRLLSRDPADRAEAHGGAFAASVRRSWRPGAGRWPALESP